MITLTFHRQSVCMGDDAGNLADIFTGAVLL